MKEEALDAEVKTRIPKAHKKRLGELALARHLKIADILREAIREKIELELAKNGKEEVPA